MAAASARVEASPTPAPPLKLTMPLIWQALYDSRASTAITRATTPDHPSYQTAPSILLDGPMPEEIFDINPRVTLISRSTPLDCIASSGAYIIKPWMGVTPEMMTLITDHDESPVVIKLGGYATPEIVRALSGPHIISIGPDSHIDAIRAIPEIIEDVILEPGTSAAQIAALPPNIRFVIVQATTILNLTATDLNLSVIAALSSKELCGLYVDPYFKAGTAPKKSYPVDAIAPRWLPELARRMLPGELIIPMQFIKPDHAQAKIDSGDASWLLFDPELSLDEIKVLSQPPTPEEPAESIAHDDATLDEVRRDLATAEAIPIPTRHHGVFYISIDSPSDDATIDADAKPGESAGPS